MCTSSASFCQACQEHGCLFQGQSFSGTNNLIPTSWPSPHAPTDPCGREGSHLLGLYLRAAPTGTIRVPVNHGVGKKGGDKVIATSQLASCFPPQISSLPSSLSIVSSQHPFQTINPSFPVPHLQTSHLSNPQEKESSFAIHSFIAYCCFVLSFSRNLEFRLSLCYLC